MANKLTYLKISYALIVWNLTKKYKKLYVYMFHYMFNIITEHILCIWKNFIPQNKIIQNVNEKNRNKLFNCIFMHI